MTDEQARYQQETDDFDEEHYNEEDDEDFDPSKEKTAHSDQEGDDGDAYETYPDGDNPSQEYKGTVDYSHVESETGGLIKTRRARMLEDELSKRQKYENLKDTTVSDSIKGIWDELKDASNKILKHQGSSGSVLANGGDLGPVLLDEKQIKIKRVYEFAGELINEEKIVPISSAEAQEYLNSTKFQQQQRQDQRKSITKLQTKNHAGVKRSATSSLSTEELKKLRRPLKRPPILEQIISGSLKPKLTTLEKSSLDWATYVDKEGINDELTLHNKDGYLAKQDFLDRVEQFKGNQYKQLRQKQLAMQLHQQQQ